MSFLVLKCMRYIAVIVYDTASDVYFGDLTEDQSYSDLMACVSK
jgi:hypothetical protein